MPESERGSALERMRALVESGQTPAELPIHAVIGLVELA
jgi:hypothetical protein